MKDFEKPTTYTEGANVVKVYEGANHTWSNSSGKPLISLKDWNNRRVQATPEICWNGIACPKCGKEMFDSEPSFVLAVMPPRMGVACVCGYHGTRLV